MLFLLPAVGFSLERSDWATLAGVALFAIAGVAVGGDRDRCLLGVRRVNWFHYMIGVSSAILAQGLAVASVGE